MTAQQQAEKLIDEAYLFSSVPEWLKEIDATRIAFWCAKKIASNIGFSSNDEYWAEVVECLKEKLIKHEIDINTLS
jgi:hypothetical protein